MIPREPDASVLMYRSPATVSIRPAALATSAVSTAAVCPLLRLRSRRERFCRRGALVHAARFDVRAALQARDLFALFGDRLLQCGDLAKQVHQQGFKLWTA